MTAPLTASMPAAADALPLLPEIVLVAGAFALLILDLFIDKRHKLVTQTISVGLLLAVLGMVLAGCGGHGAVFDGMFVRDVAADVMKAAILGVTTLAMVYSWSYLRERDLCHVETDPLGYVTASLTRHGVDVAEYTVAVEPGIARPAKV